MNCGPPDQLAPCFLDLNWDHCVGRTDRLDSALSSMVSSPAPNSPPPAESLDLHSLVGQLASISGAGQMSLPQASYTVNSLNSPPKLDLSLLGHLHGGRPLADIPMPATCLDQFFNGPGFTERAAWLSSFDGRHYAGLPGHYGLPETGNVPDFSSNLCLEVKKPQIGMRPVANDAELGNGPEESSVSDPASASKDAIFRGPSESNAKKRKAGSKGKGKEASLTNSAKDSLKTGDEKDSDAKRCKMAEGEENSAKHKVEQNRAGNSKGDGSQKQGKEKNPTLAEPPKDYIHVRARRGQATDSHSLAERVRREKISLRMKLLQDLVPGCNKVTGKAVMLDEIINYVQSLQRQVEFLSMKLATVNPQLDLTNLPNLLPKEMHRACGLLLGSGFPLETSGSAFSYANQAHQGNPGHCFIANGIEFHCAVDPLDSTLSQAPITHQSFLNGSSSDAPMQQGNLWEYDLQNVLQMDIGQNHEIGVSNQNFHGQLQGAHMQIEL